MSDKAIALGIVLRDERKSRDLSLGDVAFEVLKDRNRKTSVSKIESGSVNVTFKNAFKYFDFYGILDVLPDFFEFNYKERMELLKSDGIKRNKSINSKVLRKRFEPEMKRFFAGCTTVVSAPGQIIITGEKVTVDKCTTGTSLAIPRRTYVGLKRRTDDKVGFKLLDSQVLVENTSQHDSLPLGPVSYKFQPENKFMLRALQSASEFLVDKYEIKQGFEVKIWTEWKTETGLGWSGAFSLALAAALLCECSEVHLNSPIWKSADKLGKDHQKVVRLGWIIEACLHNGRSSGMAVCCPMHSGPFPLLYRTKNIPKLWSLEDPKPDVETDYSKFWKDRDLRLSRYNSFDHYKDEFWAIESVSNTKSHRKKSYDEFYENISIFVISSGTTKSTAATSSAEFKRRSKDAERVLDDLAVPLRKVFNRSADRFKNLSEVRNGIDDDQLSDADLWISAVDDIGRVGKILGALGFRFDLGDNILSNLRQSIRQMDSSVTEFGPVFGDGKTTGAGTGGCLIFFLRHYHEEDPRYIYEALEKVRESAVSTVSTPSVLYDSNVDGFEFRGLVFEESLIS
ncbi:MAG: helix-turn-helix domain-containing protein [Pikeienuella sp.]